MKNVNPWKNIWIQPASVIRFLISTDPKYAVIPLSISYGILLNVPAIYLLKDELSISYFWIAVSLIIFGAVFGIITLYLRGFLLKVVGKLIGAHAFMPNIRAAIAWSSLPEITAYLLQFIYISIQYFWRNQIDVNESFPIFWGIGLFFGNLAYYGVGLVGFLWAVVLLLNSLSVVFHITRRRVLVMLFLYIVIIEIPLHSCQLIFQSP
jgi:hypothetical protein